MTPSPYSLSLTALISFLCEEWDKSPLYCDLEEPIREKTSIAVQLFLLNVLNDGSVTEAMLASKSVRSLIQAVKINVGEDIAKNFLKWLKISSSSIDALVDLMAVARNTTRSGAVDPTSLSGSFVRDITLGFEDLSFEALTQLWNCYRSEVQEASIPYDFPSPQEQSKSNWTQHPDQIESGLRHLLRNEGSVDDIVKSMFDTLPDSAQSTEQSMSSSALSEESSLPSLHLLKFLKSVREGERVEAIEQLHSYFDRALIRIPKKSKGRVESRHIMQFAPILLSALHCQTGNTDLSFLATEEAARVAQHSQDTACVAFALGWLYENGLSAGIVNDGNFLNRCARRAAEGDRQNLLVGAKFLLVRQALMAGRKDQRTASQAWGHLFDAIAELPSTEAASLYDRSTRISHVPNGKVCQDAMARQRVVASSVWESFGQNSAAALSSLVCLLCHQNLSSDDARPAIQNVSRQALFGSQSLLGETNNLPQRVGQKSVSESSLAKDGSSCVYGQAVSALVKLSESFGFSLTEELGRQVQLLLHEWAVRRGDMQDAEGLMRQLRSNIRPFENMNLKPLRQMKLQEAFMCSENGNYEEARTIRKDLLVSCEDSGSTGDAELILLHRAFHHLESSPEYPANAIAPVIDCLSRCEQSQLEGTKGPALAVLGNMFLRLDEPELSLSTLRHALPSLLQNDHVWFQGRAFLTISKCYLRLAKLSETSEAIAKRKVRSALKFLLRAEEVLERCQDAKGLREIYYLQARLYSSPLVRDEAAMKIAAGKFVEVSRHLATGKLRADVIRGAQTNSHLMNLSRRGFPCRVESDRRS